MRLSELLPRCLPQYDFRVVNEADFDTLGLVGYHPEGRICTFVESEKYLQEVGDGVSMILTTEALAETACSRGWGACVVKSPRQVFFRLHNALAADPAYARARRPTVTGNNCCIHPTAVISEENVVIGDNVVIEEYVVIRDNVHIGDGSIIRAGVKLGFDDFEFKRENGTIFRVEHCGGVVIGKDVEIFPNSGVSKALYPWDDTVVGDYCKLDMLVQLSHGVKIGRETMIVGLSGVGGRTEIGDNCWLGYGSIVRNGIKIGSNARVNMGAVVSRDVAEGQSVTGNFAIDHDRFMKNLKEAAKG